MIRAYHSPENLDEALALVARGAVPVGGATALFTARSSRDVELVDVTRLGLDRIQVEAGRIVMGASVTLTQIARASELPGMPGALLRRSIRTAASEPLRNMITLAGNIVSANYWADLPPVLLALDAEVEIRKQGDAPRTIPFATCLEPGRHPWEGGLVTSVSVPVPQARQLFGYERFVRTATDYALATACVTATLVGEVMKDVHVVFGAIQTRPFRATGAEEELEGKSFGQAEIDAAIVALGELPIAPNYRAPAAYRRKVAGVLARRAMQTASGWAKEV